MDRIAEMRARVADAPRVATMPVTEFRADGTGDTRSMTITGHAAVFDRLSEDLGFAGYSFREKVKRGAFRKVLDEMQDVRLLINHDANLVLARTTSKTLELREDPKGLRVFADVGPTSFAEDLRVQMERGDVDQMSFGFTVGADEWVETHNADGTSEVIRTITEIDTLLDVSVVTFPAYPQTDATARDAEAARMTEIVEGAIARALSKSGIDHTNTGPGASASGEELGGDATASAGDTADADQDMPGATGEEDERHLRTAWRRDRLRLLALTPRTVNRAADQAALLVEDL